MFFHFNSFAFVKKQLLSRFFVGNYFYLTYYCIKSVKGLIFLDKSILNHILRYEKSRLNSYPFHWDISIHICSEKSS